jgi:low affinity Fe/Cu permease
MDGQRAGIAIPNHAKLDEILNALGDARNEISRMDEEEPEEIERRRQHMRKDD